MTILQAYVLFGIPLMATGLGVAALLWTRWEDRREEQRRHTPGE